jgi:uncharacterized DUF497 family protein
MYPRAILWDLDDDPEGNVMHCAEHEVSKEEVEEIFDHFEDIDVSRSSGRPAIFGETKSGRYLLVVYEIVENDCVYPITAYDVPRSREP